MLKERKKESDAFNLDCASAGRSWDGRWLMIAVVVVFALTLGGLISKFGSSKVWTRAGVLPMGAPFADLYLFPASQFELAAGGNPYVQNSADPWNRVYNYPRIWLSVMHFPADRIPIIGFSLGLIWFGGLLLWWGRLTVAQGLLGTIMVCSPPVLLALERGNTDLIIFLVVLFLLGALHRGWLVASWSAWLVGFVFKLYPAVILPVFLRLGWRRAWPWLAVAVCFVSAYTYWRLDEIRTIARNTGTGMWLSYGSTNWTKAANRVEYLRDGLKGAFESYTFPSMVCAGLLVAATFAMGLRRMPQPSDPQPDRFLDGFRAGASVYVATFVITSSFVYRLIFLLLCIPWLWPSLNADEKGFRRTRLLCLGLLGGMLWFNPVWWFPLVIGREVCAWGLLAGFGWLMGATARLTHADSLRPMLRI